MLKESPPEFAAIRETASDGAPVPDVHVFIGDPPESLQCVSKFLYPVIYIDATETHTYTHTERLHMQLCPQTTGKLTDLDSSSFECKLSPSSREQVGLTPDSLFSSPRAKPFLHTVH